MNRINHLAIIMDGNGRWATNQNLSRTRGHIAGARSAFEIIHYVSQTDISTLSLFAFSKENWGRPKIEVSVLMRLLARSLEEKIPFFMEVGIKVQIIGDRDGLPLPVIKSIDQAEEITSGNQGLKLLIAVNYSGQHDICQAIKRMAREQIDLSQIKVQDIENTLLTGAFANPDLIIRTGGESRLSNFFLWQAAYAEIHFEEKFWPDFKSDDLDRHFMKFSKTERRFGRTSGQVAQR
jgi:undecaprenyl diphosphate synthase